MAQIFHPSFNTLSKVSIFGGVFFLGVGVIGWDTMLRSSYMTQVNVAREQPVPFSHKHHVQGLGLDCRFCHSFVEQSRFAGIPSTKTCMSCHSVVWKDAQILEPVRKSYRDDEPIAWVRVHDLPDFAYFDHSIHVKQGVGCSTCHGQVDEMPLMWRTQTLNMDWCLDCHRSPERYLRSRNRIFDMDWQRQSDLSGEELVALHGVDPSQDCSTCHR